MEKTMDYKSAGVDIEAGYQSVELLKKPVRETMRPEVLGGLGGLELLLIGGLRPPPTGGLGPPAGGRGLGGGGGMGFLRRRYHALPGRCHQKIGR